MTFHYDKDAQGIVTVIMDMDGPANTMGPDFVTLMRGTVDRLEAEEGLTGVVIASAKHTFFAGGDLKAILATEEADAGYLDFLTENKGQLRRLERLPVPVVAAINGAAMGGGFEICLACNHRIADASAGTVGLPEVTLGLLPAAGGIVRTIALIGLEKGLPFVLEGKPARPAKALELGLVDALVDNGAMLVEAAKTWIRANPDAHVQPWDRKGFTYPGGNSETPANRMMIAGAPVMLFNRTRGRLPAPEAVLDVAVNSTRMGFDAALDMESRRFLPLVVSPQAKAAITTFFLGMNGIKSGKFRPEGAKWAATSSAVLGAGMMGAGIAWSHAAHGLPVSLKDMSLANAEKGRAYSEALVARQTARGSMTEEAGARLLAAITPTDRNDFAGVDILVEAVFEDIALKEKVIADTFGLIGTDGIYGTNTSTLPITELAKAAPDPSRFIGIHFFSPVDKMQLVELIVGEKTSEETVRKACDYCVQIGKIPMVINDSRGFFTSRVFSTFLDEGQALVHDGMAPAAVERAAWMVGMPVGPLQVMDEVSLILIRKAHDTNMDLDRRLPDNLYKTKNAYSESIAFDMIEQGRGGRQYGGGFYDYAADGQRTLWPGLKDYARGNSRVGMEDAMDRILYRQVIEALRCMDEGVLRSEVEANIGSIFGIGFPAWTGGALHYVRFVGVETFAKRADELAERYGERFALSRDVYAKLLDGSGFRVGQADKVALADPEAQSA
ncbi:3-hydroxyacyl-CoA dehydrogenase NAD-binding domain-containing protein [Chachezhania sediminis]|uniref:3-hydroxyacyl-CoA dehydrogenase NAD-binding domain-containing protein n=1 Tax=Chachezhania sediminis TaxID=2599291 RepID=UPI00131E730C|nr:3-hydroxyacyl-CoA dehydrogenase NAD-binding domain-containing protein [Chachezhania sediminis]